MSNSIVEKRDYTIDSEWFGACKEWAKNLACPWLKENLHVIDFWHDEGLESEVEGSSTIVSLNARFMKAVW